MFTFSAHGSRMYEGSNCVQAARRRRPAAVVPQRRIPGASPPPTRSCSRALRDGHAQHFLLARSTPSARRRPTPPAPIDAIMRYALRLGTFHLPPISFAFSSSDLPLLRAHSTRLEDRTPPSPPSPLPFLSSPSRAYPSPRSSLPPGPFAHPVPPSAVSPTTRSGGRVAHTPGVPRGTVRDCHAAARACERQGWGTEGRRTMCAGERAREWDAMSPVSQVDACGAGRGGGGRHRTRPRRAVVRPGLSLSFLLGSRLPPGWDRRRLGITGSLRLGLVVWFAAAARVVLGRRCIALACRMRRDERVKGVKCGARSPRLPSTRPSVAHRGFPYSPTHQHIHTRPRILPVYPRRRKKKSEREDPLRSSPLLD
ncbi:hypothetical protein OF83DRAFT_482569 [Amylostereum chailletii]|nr:hypothetical protein OF83DRAFT_482569 [Amylostereum chailletii]